MAMLTRLTTAPAPGSPKALQRFQNCIAFLWPSLQSQPSQQKSTQLDSIDCFTNELVDQNTKKWAELCNNITKSKKQPNVKGKPSAEFNQSVGLLSKGVVSDFKAIRSPQLGLDIRSLSQAQLDNLLSSTVEIKNKVDFLYLIRQCIRWQQLPSNDILVACLKYLSTLCRVQQIEAFAEICRTQEHPLSKVYSNFAAFKAMALWHTGGADVALMILHRGYGESSKTEEGRRVIRNAFRNIAEETLRGKSEAVLVALMEVARAIFLEHNDIFVIACVWKQCFASDWFCDQKSAAELFEHYEELRQLVAKRSLSLSSSFLGRNNIDAVHRLIEAFLQYKEKEACANCLSQLFNYQYMRKDLRACAEIIKSCSELEMPLCELQNEQFLSLFLDQSTSKSKPPTLPTNHKSSFKEFQYKF